MATSTRMSLPLSLFLLSLILVLAPGTKADITAQNRRTRINGGETLTDGQMDMVVRRDCSIVLFYKLIPVPAFVLNTDIPTRDCYLYVSNRGVLYVHTNDIKMADRPLFGEESQEGSYALVLHFSTLAIYGPSIWSNGVGHKQSNLMQEELSSAISASPDNVFYSGADLQGNENGDVEVEREGDVAAFLRPDCTLAVQRNNGEVLWSTRTDHKVMGQCKLKLRSNGQLVIRDYFSVVRDGKKLNLFAELFNSGSESKRNSYICLLFPEGELVISGLKEGIFKGLLPRAEVAAQ